jgi:hypothetical protein
MAKTYAPRLNGQVSDQEWFNGLQEDAQHYTSQYSNVKESTFAGGATGNGLTDDTAAIAAAFADADANNRSVFFPPGTYLTGTIDYKMQPVIGTHKNQCIILGKPSQDVFHVNASVGQFYRQAGLFANLTIKVDDSVDASASFPWRQGTYAPIGNAGYAVDWDNRLDPSPPMAIDWHFENLEITGSGHVNGGRNNACGWYVQSNHLSQCIIDGVNWSYLTHGWSDHWSTLNLTAGTNSRDHCKVNDAHFLRCAYEWRIVNWGVMDIANVMFHGGNNVVSLEIMGKNTSSTGKSHSIHMTALEFAGATATGTPPSGLIVHPEVENLTIDGMTVSGMLTVDWAASYSRLTGCGFQTTSPGGIPSLIVSGNNNLMLLYGIGADAEPYGFDAVKDTGAGNQIFIQSRNTAIPYQIESLTPDGRYGKLRDVHPVMLGITDPLPISGNDWLINPRMLKPSGTQGTTWDYVRDETADFRMVLRDTDGTFNLDNNNINGDDGFYVGKFLPATKVRVYVKAKLATGGTQTLTLQTLVPTVTKGQIVGATWTSSYTVNSFDADLTGMTGSTLRLAFGIVGGGGVAPLDVAAIWFRPWTNDTLDSMQGMSADNGDASKTLVVGTDQYAQRWATAITANRTVTLPTSANQGQIRPNARFRINRESTATGAFTLTVNPPARTVAIGSWLEFMYDSPANVWRVIGGGTL